jgi:REP element-mobilizing transposase RayT
MANTFTQFYIQVVFSPMNRDCLIHASWEDELYKYITGIVQNNRHKMIAINGMPDHIHIFYGMKPHQGVSDLVRDIKANSSKWINQRRFVRGKFSWQEGYGGFSYGHTEIDSVAKYVMNQKDHHKKNSFREEYLLFLKEYEIEFKDEYLFDFLE